MSAKRIITWSVVGFFLLLILGAGLELGTGYFGVLKKKTVGKAMQNAEREVFEETQSYVHGKRQEALKYYNEWQESDAEGREIIENQVANVFAYFDEENLTGEVKTFVSNCKYNRKIE
jgi:hypothetical protein